ncbi:polyketide synthase dehydratase domain-containing protein, partial [Frankia sp. ACN10a]
RTKPPTTTLATALATLQAAGHTPTPPSISSAVPSAQGATGDDTSPDSSTSPHSSTSPASSAADAGDPARLAAALPTYPFQRQRYWLREASTGGHSVAGLGLASADHPLLGAAIGLADQDGVLFSGRLSLATHPWLADHAVQGNVLVPGTAFVELALRAGDDLGVGALDELVFEAPLILPERAAVAIQVTVTAADDTGRRPVAVHSRPQDSPDAAWTRHASGVFAAADGDEGAGAGDAPEALTAWPPPGALEVPVGDVYPALAASGLAYGPAFQGLHAAWRAGDDLYAEVTLPDAGTDQHQAAAFGVHPALLDAAVHLSVFHGLADVPAGHSRLPFAWNGVRLHATGATSLRVHVDVHGTDEISLHATDPAGAPVITVDSLLARVVSAEQLAAARRRRSDSLYEVTWPPLRLSAAGPGATNWAVIGSGDAVPAELGASVTRTDHPDLASLGVAVEAGAAVPDLVVLSLGALPLGPPAHDGLRTDAGDLAGPTGAPDLPDVPAAARAATERAVDLLRAYLSEQRWDATRLVVLTSGAVSVAGEDVDLTTAPLWGLVRTAQNEHPDRILLIDLDADPDSRTALPAAVATAQATGDNQLALRRGTAHTPRLVPATTPDAADAADATNPAGPADQADPAGPAGPAGWNLDPDGTVLITGGL